MPDISTVEQIIFDAIDELNLTAQEGQPLGKDPDTVLFGDEGRLDSIGLVHLVVGIEERIEDRLGTPVTIADARAMSQERSPFSTIGYLAVYLEQLILEAEGA